MRIRQEPEKFQGSAGEVGQSRDPPGRRSVLEDIMEVHDFVALKRELFAGLRGGSSNPPPVPARHLCPQLVLEPGHGLSPPPKPKPRNRLRPTHEPGGSPNPQPGSATGGELRLKSSPGAAALNLLALAKEGLVRKDLLQRLHQLEGRRLREVREG